MSSVPAIADLMDQAIGLHRAGDLRAAEALYQQVLREAPSHFDCLHMLGAVALQRELPGEALVWLRRALEVREADDALHFHLSLALAAQDQWAEALVHCGRSLALAERQAQAWDHHARILAALGRDESLGRLDDALQQTK